MIIDFKKASSKAYDPVYTGSDLNGSVPKLVQIGLAFTRDLTDPIPFGSAIRTSSGSLLEIVPFGSDPMKIPCKQVGSDPNRQWSDTRQEKFYYEVFLSW